MSTARDRPAPISRAPPKPVLMPQREGQLRQAFFGLWAAALVANPAAASSSPRDQLRVIVQVQCLPHWLADHTAEPCERLGGPPDTAASAGYAVLHDRKGGAHFLLIPTATIRGIEDPILLAPDAPNYFAAAWKNRDLLTSVTGLLLGRDAIGMAINHVHARSQDQFHIHLSCVGADAREALRENAGHIGSDWTPLTILSRPYYAMRIDGERLDGANPVAMLANRLKGARNAMGDYTLLVAGMTYEDRPGFVLIAGNAVPGAERLLDSACTVAR
jgi:CDP-diacylglycerol pyrophosphatase